MFQKFEIKDKEFQRFSWEWLRKVINLKMYNTFYQDFLKIFLKKVTREVTRLQLTISVDFIDFIVVTIGLHRGYIRLQFPKETFQVFY